MDLVLAVLTTRGFLVSKGGAEALATQPEAQLSERITKALKKEARARGHELFIFKVHGHDQQMAGVPDLLACYRGMFIGLEVKMPGNEPSKIQMYRLGQIARSGGVVEVPYSVSEALDVLNEVDRRLNLSQGLTEPCKTGARHGYIGRYPDCQHD